MTTKRILLDQASQGRGPLGKAKDDEPVFLLVGDDLFAPGFVELWAAALSQTTVGRKRTNDEMLKILDAQMIATEMRKWQTKHGAKVPD